jgi:hypothetical protein
MSAFFGIEARYASGFLDKGAVCVQMKDADMLSMLSCMRAEDVVFIKDFSAQGGLQVTAAGIVQPGSVCEKGVDLCLPVKWVWKGQKTLEELDENFSASAAPFYEEHNITAQREIIDLAPADLQLPDEW